MAKRVSLALMVTLTLLAALIQTTVAQKVHVVGGSLGWIVPPGGPIAYSTWASMQTFTAGDLLMFNFTTGQQDVAMVTKESFDSCNSANPIWLQTTGPYTFTLRFGGEYYFIGTMARHCFLGQKLAINVTGTPGPTASPASPTPPSTPVPTPPIAPVTHVVGDKLGWIVPPGGPIAYSTWASMQTFNVGDILKFNFTTGQQDVARVTKEAFDSCNSANPIWLQTTGPVDFTLSSGGQYYFIGTMARHCFLGQKLAINVTGATSPTASPAPPPPPSTPVPAPPRVPATYIVGDGLGWVVPPGGPIAYSTWAYDKTFFVGDILVFNFVKGSEDVAVVSKAAYESCNTTTTTTVLTTSPVNYTLTTPGENFFTCTFPQHCYLGQKLAINVTATSTPGMPPSSSATSPSSPTSSSSDYAPTAGGPIPPPTSSAQSHTMIGLFYLTFLSIATAFLF